jgi:hypothetical protein
MKRIISFFSILFLLTGLASGQTTDSTKVEYTEETNESSDFSLKESYNYLIRAQVEEKALLKLGIAGFGISNKGSYLTYVVAYEKKLKPEFSVIAEVRHRVGKKVSYEHRETVAAFNAGGRYYYNLNKRIRKGKSANNFSANYLGLSLENQIVRHEFKNHYEPNLLAVFGLQRRISKYGFVDFNIGPGVQWEDGNRNFVIKTAFSIGLGF